MRRPVAIALTVVTLLVIGNATYALADNTDTPTPTTLELSPPTTSEYGTETEIVIALDNDGNIVPGEP